MAVLDPETESLVILRTVVHGAFLAGSLETGVHVDGASLCFGVGCTYMHIHARLRVPVPIFIASDILTLRKHVNPNHVDVLSTSFWISLLLVFEYQACAARHQQDTCDGTLTCHIIRHKCQLTSLRMRHAWFGWVANHCRRAKFPSGSLTDAYD